MESEIWKAILGYEGLYQVSSMGKVKSLNYRHTGREQELKLGTLSNGYLVVNLGKNGKIKLFYVHQLVAMTFLGHNPNGHKLVVNHKNSNKQDNRPENLEIITNRANCSIEKTIKSGLPVGVGYHKQSKKYQSLIGINGNRTHLGLFSTPEEASEAYQAALSNL